MHYKYFKLTLVLIFSFSLNFFPSDLNASAGNKEEAQMKALADAGATSETKEEIFYPQRLDKVISVEREPVQKKEEGVEVSQEDKEDVEKGKMLYPQRMKKVVSVEEEPAQKLETFYHFMPSSGANDQSGRITVQESAFEYSYQLKAFGKLPVEFGLGADYINIKNSTVVKVPAKLTEIAFGVNTTLPVPFTKKTYFRIGVSPQFASDNWNLRSNSFSIPVNSLLIYQPNDKLTLIAGTIITASGKDKFTPYGGLIYDPGNEWLFEIIPPRPVITYTLNDKVDLFTEFNITNSDFKVTKDGYRGAELEYKDMRAGFGTVYKFNKYIQASLSAGGVFNRWLKYRDSLGKVDIKSGAYVELRVEVGI